MIRPQIIAESMNSIKTVGNLSQLFLSIASIEISRIKKQVDSSQVFFDDLWRIYTALRGAQGRPVRRAAIEKQVFVAITAEGSFSGDIDEKLIRWMLEQYDAATTDIICIGHHGAIQLAQAGIPVVQYFKLPSGKDPIELSAVIPLIEQYASATAFYQTYVSLSVQDVKRINLQRVVKQLEPTTSADDMLISEQSYILEPSPEAVIAHLESTMLSIALAQVVLESRLAQQASRFRAMSVSRDRADEMYQDIRLDYHRARRSLTDERLKEIIAGLRHIRALKAAAYE